MALRGDGAAHLFGGDLRGEKAARESEARRVRREDVVERICGLRRVELEMDIPGVEDETALAGDLLGRAREHQITEVRHEMDGREADALRLDPCGVEIGIERSREAAVRMEGHLFEPGHGSVERIHVGVDRQLARVRVEIEPVDRDADLASLRADTAALGLPEGDIELSGEGLAVLLPGSHRG